MAPRLHVVHSSLNYMGLLFCSPWKASRAHKIDSWDSSYEGRKGGLPFDMDPTMFPLLFISAAWEPPLCMQGVGFQSKPRKKQALTLAAAEQRWWELSVLSLESTACGNCWGPCLTTSSISLHSGKKEAGQDGCCEWIVSSNFTAPSCRIDLACGNLKYA